jgi:hypothetical protein
MPNICLRNPQLKSKNVSNVNVKSTVLYLLINNTLRYTIAKNKVDGQGYATFDISELARDYLNITYTSSNFPQSINIISVLTNFDDYNGTGNQFGGNTNYFDAGFEAYGTYQDGANPLNPVYRSISNGTWLLAADSTSYSNNKFEIFLPNDEPSFVAGMDAFGLGVTHYISPTATSYQASNIDEELKITRINCSKYGNGRKIIFINKYGAQQDLWFSLKEVQNISRKNDSYKSNTILTQEDIDPYYQLEDAPVKTFNTQAKKTYTLSSGYYPEWAVEYFEQLLLSEYVWMKVFRRQNPASQITIPVRVKSSSMSLKTSLNDQLINYTIQFEDAFDYINNIR